RQLEEIELGCGPQNPFLGPRAEMLGDHRQNKGRLQDKIAIAGDIDAVRSHIGKAEPLRSFLSIDRQAGAGKCRCTEAPNVKWIAGISDALPVTLELLAIGKPIMGREHWLSPLQMCIAR